MKFLTASTVLYCLTLTVETQNSPYRNIRNGNLGPVRPYDTYDGRYEQVKPVNADAASDFDTNNRRNVNTPKPRDGLQPRWQKQRDVDMSADNSYGTSKEFTPAPIVIPLSQAITEFGINLIGNLDSSTGTNVVVSPYSVITLLALLQQGASGTTLEELSKVIGMQPNAVAAEYKSMNDDLLARKSDANTFKSASNIFMANEFSLNADFKRRARNNFGSDVTVLNFRNTELVVKTINDWVAKETNNKIDKLISPDLISDHTQLVLANAVYFKGLWDQMFRTLSTIPKDFYLRNGQTKTVQYMRMRHLYKAGIDKKTGVQVAVIPFKNLEYSLVVMLPPPVGMDLNKLHDTLRNGKLLSYQNLPYEDVHLELPRFTVKAKIDLQPVLEKMGLSTIFNHEAELSGIGTYWNISPEVSSALHSAVMTIDEKGGSAAAASAVAAVALATNDANMYFHANRPFLAVIWDNKLSIPLFIAKVEEPL